MHHFATMTAAFPERTTAEEHEPEVTTDQLQACLMTFADSS